MPSQYDPNKRPVIKGVGLMEINAKLGGEYPVVLYGIAYLDGGGQTMGQVRSNVISEKAQKMLLELTAQIEADFMEVSSSELHDLPDQMETQADGLMYPTP